MTSEEFMKLEKGNVVRRLGVNYRVGTRWLLPGANYGLTELTAYRQDSAYRFSIMPDSPLVAKLHKWDN